MTEILYAAAVQFSPPRSGRQSSEHRMARLPGERRIVVKEQPTMSPEANRPLIRRSIVLITWRCD